MASPKLLTVKELAEYLDVEVKTLYNWSSAGTGPRSIKAGGRLRYRPSDVEKWLERQADSRAA
jgi:excisionase family DNA binding protein